jgi:hypothetical protein
VKEVLVRPIPCEWQPLALCPFSVYSGLSSDRAQIFCQDIPLSVHPPPQDDGVSRNTFEWYNLDIDEHDLKTIGKTYVTSK